MLRGISLLQDARPAASDMGEAELEKSLKIAAKHLNGAHNRMDCALMRLSARRRPHPGPGDLLLMCSGESRLDARSPGPQQGA